VKSILQAVCVGSLMLAPGLARAEDVGNVNLGHAYVLQHCAECHAVEGADEYSPNVDAPNFTIVANTQGMTARALGVWLVTSHPTMPNLMIRDEDRDNIVAYIMSLKEKAPQ
jgi:mono/diheme cytochrome c family protein